MNEQIEKQEAQEPTVYSPPIHVDGVTVIPATQFAKGRGPRGAGIAERPAGVYVVRGGHVFWRPAIDVNRVIVGGQIVAVTALLALRPVLGYLFARRLRRRSWLSRLFA